MSDAVHHLQALKAPLRGVKVLDVSRFLAGPYAGWILAELGADVVKVEDSGRPDEARSVGPYFAGEQSLYFAALNSGKRSLAVQLASQQGRDVVLRLAQEADVVVDNNKPGVMDKLGLGAEVLAEANPQLITCSLSGFGTTGPLFDRPGYDYTMQAVSGVMSMTGEPDSPPGKAGISYVDHAGGLTAALAVCAGLVGRYKSGSGGHIELALYDIQMSMLSYLAAWQLNGGYEAERTPAASHPSLIPAQNFETGDGHISIFVGNDGMWSRLAAKLDDALLLEERFRKLTGRQAHRELVLSRLQAVLLSQPTAYWVAALTEVGVPAAPINSLKEALEGPHTVARDLVQTADHPSYGSYRYVGGPLPSLRDGALRPAPLLGEHTREIMVDLGFADSEIDQLVAQQHVLAGDSETATSEAAPSASARC
ncbi:CaiB/BaiF CoA transferase family protein [Ornithinimicrobium faecis]|uniref:CaiB/BaiF CoA transferase family protein n=1 Tax=Ornithinimicrobium faecis TaxID=2934158 RepID=UPI002118BDEE|nr:CoA transferase [Ornithinimicrobium sp. HY1745]